MLVSGHMLREVIDIGCRVELRQINPILLKFLLIQFYLTAHTLIQLLLGRLQLAFYYISKDRRVSTPSNFYVLLFA